MYSHFVTISFPIRVVVFLFFGTNFGHLVKKDWHWASTKNAFGTNGPKLPNFEGKKK
jgi:hypothetical protein